MKNADCSVASRDSEVASQTGLQVGIFQARVDVHHSLVWFAKVWNIDGSCVGGEGGRETGGSDSESRSLGDSPVLRAGLWAARSQEKRNSDSRKPAE